MEEHKGPCRCQCNVLNCHYNKLFDEDACACRCRAEFADLKRACATDYERVWREESCTCECKGRICVSGHYQGRRATSTLQIHTRICDISHLFSLHVLSKRFFFKYL